MRLRCLLPRTTKSMFVIIPSVHDGAHLILEEFCRNVKSSITFPDAARPHPFPSAHLPCWGYDPPVEWRGFLSTTLYSLPDATGARISGSTPAVSELLLTRTAWNVLAIALGGIGSRSVHHRLPEISCVCPLSCYKPP